MPNKRRVSQFNLVVVGVPILRYSRMKPRRWLSEFPTTNETRAVVVYIELAIVDDEVQSY